MSHETLIKCTIAHSLGWEEFEEQPVDRVTAIGFSTRFNEVGEAMLRVDALDAPSLRKVIFLVVRRLNQRHQITRGFAEKMAFATLHEYMRPNCIYCGGKGEVHAKGTVVTVCAYCNGSGLHRYSDGDRGSLIGGKYNQRAYEDALAYVRDAVRSVVVSSGRRLGTIE
jgi:hypothetical protein